jgi:hypothetical protein
MRTASCKFSPLQLVYVPLILSAPVILVSHELSVAGLSLVAYLGWIALIVFFYLTFFVQNLVDSVVVLAILLILTAMVWLTPQFGSPPIIYPAFFGSCVTWSVSRLHRMLVGA